VLNTAAYLGLMQCIYFPRATPVSSNRQRNEFRFRSLTNIFSLLKYHFAPKLTSRGKVRRFSLTAKAIVQFKPHQHFGIIKRFPQKKMLIGRQVSKFSIRMTCWKHQGRNWYARSVKEERKGVCTSNYVDTALHKMN
jgi:hypothetical protein